MQFDLWLHLARTDKIALGKLLLISDLSRDFLSAFDEGMIDEIIQSFVAMSDCIREFIRYRDFSILHFCALRTGTVSRLLMDKQMGWLSTFQALCIVHSLLAEMANN